MRDYLIPKSLRIQILESFNYTCQKCLKSNIKLDIHHKIPREFGGTNDFDNLIPLCRSCHKKVEYQTKKYGKFDNYNPNAITIIRIKKSTYQRLLSIGRMNESFDSLINRILDQFELYHKPTV